MSEFFINGEDTVPVYAMNEFKGHRSRTFLRILDPARGAKAALATEGNKLHIYTMRTYIHGTAKGRVATVNHPVNVFYNDLARSKDI
jgi:hypothetical protein